MDAYNVPPHACNVRPGACDVRRRLNEGNGEIVAAGTAALAAPEMWRNVSYDDATDFSLTKVVGTNAALAYANQTAGYVLTSYTRCGKQRTRGGDGYRVRMTKGRFDTFAAVTDADDGSYHVRYGLTGPGALDGCGVYATEV
eukprot:1194381-Prorocentrum_minimum.AAC.5